MTFRWRREFVLVALVCLGPLALAALAYFGPANLRPAASLPNPDRELLPVPVSMPLVPLHQPSGTSTEPDWSRFRWSLIYARISPCEGRCVLHLERLTQVYLALGRDRERAQRVFLTADIDSPIVDSLGFTIGLLNRDRDAELIQALGVDRLERGRLFVVDPLGNLILSYPPDADQARLLKDLERLLNVSRIG